MTRFISKSVAVLELFTSVALAADALPSWNDGAAKKAIVEFVTKVTAAGSRDSVPAPERIATFDNDGARALVRKARARSIVFRTRAREDTRSAAPRMEDEGAVRLATEGRLELRSQRRQTVTSAECWSSQLISDPYMPPKNSHGRMSVVG